MSSTELHFRGYKLSAVASTDSLCFSLYFATKEIVRVLSARYKLQANATTDRPDLNSDFPTNKIYLRVRNDIPPGTEWHISGYKLLV